MITKEYQSTASISFHDFRQYLSGRRITGFFSLRMKILDCQKQNVINMCQHPAYQVNVSRKGVLCAGNFLGHPVLCVIGKTIRMIMIEFRMFSYNFAHTIVSDT